MTYALELEKLTKTYHGGGVKAVRGINLRVEAGDFYALLGPNGAGKSTMIGIISSLVNKSSGKVRVFGYDLEHDIVNAKRQLGLVPQEFNFNPFETVLQIVTHQAGYYGVSRQVALQRAEKYLKQLDLWEKRQKKARMLSGGMKRRLMIARALMHEPKLLILDEPTAGVDIELRRSMWGFLKSLNKQGTTIILTTHYLEEAEMLCRNIGIIQHGELVENTSIKALLAKVKSETFILDLAPKSLLPRLEGYAYRLTDMSTLEVDVMREQGLNKIFSQLSAQGIQILSMRNKANRLEELFVSMINGENKSINASGKAKIV
ncbi:MAG: ABC transporter ATP-binding protein [Candidatus Malihini olakiniferum]